MVVPIIYVFKNIYDDDYDSEKLASHPPALYGYE